VSTLYAKDFEPGDQFEFGSHTVTEDEIIEFARRYDPQPFHVDPDSAEDSLFGELVASGWHVVSLTNRMVRNAVYGRMALLGGYGSDEVRFHVSPTRPGDTLSEVIEFAEVPSPPTAPSRDLSFSVTSHNQELETVFTMVNHAILGTGHEQY